MDLQGVFWAEPPLARRLTSCSDSRCQRSPVFMTAMGNSASRNLWTQLYKGFSMYFESKSPHPTVYTPDHPVPVPCSKRDVYPKSLRYDLSNQWQYFIELYMMAVEFCVPARCEDLSITIPGVFPWLWLVSSHHNAVGSRKNVLENGVKHQANKYTKN